MTTDTDKLVEMARAAGFILHNGTLQSLADDLTGQLAAFASAHIASLCGDVEPVGRFIETRLAGFQQTFTHCDKPIYLYDASTVAALKARVAELEKDAARLEFVCNSPNRMVERESGLWRVYEDVAPADHPTAVWQGMTPRWHVTPREAIDAAITAALTKGQP